MFFEDNNTYMCKRVANTSYNGRACRIVAEYGLRQIGGNKHSHWTITGHIELLRPRNRSERDDPWLTCGCIHDEILQQWPDLKPYVDLHLSAYGGNPMHAAENAWYFAGGYNTDKLIGGKCPGNPTALASHLRIDVDTASHICDEVARGLWNKEGFTTYIMQNYAEKWKAEHVSALFKLAEEIENAGTKS